ncbi:MAG: hypothetical protein HPY50_01945 [Firmicutes bacterium]|nr:hypothetical protein [Bacillota bacterium]
MKEDILIQQLEAKTLEFKQFMQKAVGSINKNIIEPIEKDGIYADVDISVLQYIETNGSRLFSDINRLRNLLNITPYSQEKK